jgi:hypothetical protein
MNDRYDWFEFIDRLAGLLFKSQYPLIDEAYDDAEVFYLAYHCGDESHEG